MHQLSAYLVDDEISYLKLIVFLYKRPFFSTLSYAI